ncbi:MAG: hypothetical protein KGI73_00555 [Patescibacteria group bacterium]|nr:hypothetical protein [Patescibacteria group bacterium]
MSTEFPIDRKPTLDKQPALSAGAEAFRIMEGHTAHAVMSWPLEIWNGLRVARKTLLERAGGDETPWVGSISLQNRIDQDPSFETRVNSALSKVGRYFKKVSRRAPARCSDGRESERGPDAPLGPQGFAASVGVALAHHFCSGGVGKTLSADLRATLKEFKKHGMVCGGHIDEGCSCGRTGCAGVDRIKEIFGKMASADAAEGIQKLTQKILGRAFDQKVFDGIIGQVKELQAKEEDYFDDGWQDNALAAVEETARGKHKPVEKLLGSHNEVAIVVNKVKRTTFNSTKFSQDTGGEIQVFNYDVWDVHRVARKLYPHSAARRKKYLTCRVMLAAATLMVLTDGTLRILVNE